MSITHTEFKRNVGVQRVPAAQVERRSADKINQERVEGLVGGDRHPAHFYDIASEKFRAEFVDGSAIAPSVYSAAVQLLPDFRIGDDGEPEYPIHDALGWKVTRFGKHANETNLAAAFIQEDGSIWQLKLAKPRRKQDGSETKTYKYENPKGAGSRAYLPPVPSDIREILGAPLEGSFWDWLERTPQIPITITEGGKKDLSLLTHEDGSVAIALAGVNGGYRKLPGDTRQLIPDIARFCHPDRQFTLAFDQDIKPKTRKRVERALKRFGGLLERAGAKSVAIATWDKGLGKGVDDLIAQNGVEQWETAYSKALTLTDWAILLELQSKLTIPANITLNTPDLSTVDIGAIPETGIIGITSPKGTGKTKAMAKMVDETGGNLNITHRRALGRNLAQRMGLEYRDAVSRVNDRHAVDDGFYRLGIVGCVDWLMAIQPEAWEGCTLFIDEVTQVVRHLLTSSTCSQDGKRPILLARFRQLIAGAKRVIVADADLDNQTLQYLQDLRGDGGKAFLIRNDYKSAGYAVRLIESGTRDAVVQELLDALEKLKPGEIVYTALDSKALSKQILLLVEAKFPEINTLVINAETSGDGDAREFIKDPHPIVASGDYQLILGTPSVGTGVSIEPPTPHTNDGWVWRVTQVFGIFQGVSITDSDMAQALVRVRETVPRTVWCAAKGSAFSKLGTSSNSLELKAALKTRTDMTTALVRSQLREDSIDALTNYDWQSDPHVNMWARIEADRNCSMWALGDRLRVRLQHEGNHVTRVQIELDDDAIAEQLKWAREVIRDREADEILSAPAYTLSEVSELSKKQSLAPDEKAGIATFWLREFYCVETLTKELILEDKGGQRRAQLASLEHLLYPETAIDRTVKSIETQLAWNCGNCPWDVTGAELRRKTRETLGLLDFLEEGREWTADDISPYAEKIRQYASAIKIALNVTINDRMSDIQVVHQLLSQLGLRTQFRWVRTEGVKRRVYSLNQDHWQKFKTILDRRLQRRIEQQLAVDHPPVYIPKLRGGDPTIPTTTNAQKQDFWGPENLIELEEMKAIAHQHPDDNDEIIAFLTQFSELEAIA